MANVRVAGQYVVLIASTLGVILATVLLGFTSTASYERSCLQCHAAVAKAQQTTVHKGLACARCHREQSFFGALDFRIRMLTMAGAYILGTGGPSPGVTSRACLACHESILTKVVQSGGLRMSHREPTEAGRQCIQCHGKTGHGTAVTSAVGISMDECMRCHLASAASNECATCHVGKVTREQRLRSSTFAKTHGPAWRTTHGMGDLALCGSCHTAIRCSSCHGTNLPHSDAWLNEHGRQSRNVNCESCHARRFCSNCHRIAMPHPSNFLRRHSREASGGGKARCYKCHAKRSCERCHAGHIHPGLKPERIRELRRKAGLSVP